MSARSEAAAMPAMPERRRRAARSATAALGRLSAKVTARMMASLTLRAS